MTRLQRKLRFTIALLGMLITLCPLRTWSAMHVVLTDMPDYAWFYGCMGTASGNLMGFWDRHGFPDFYTGPANGGLAPLTTGGANIGIVSMWASTANFDGRPADKPGHVDDYYISYESTALDPYVTAGRPEHAPDCIGDFMGLNQRKWTNMANECSGNIDAFSFVFWDTNGDRRVNFVPTDEAGHPIRDIQSGLRGWTQYRGYDCSVFTQLMNFDPEIPRGNGFSFNDLKAEIDAGYPVILFMQPTNQFSRNFQEATNLNPVIHSMVAHGYYVDDSGINYVKYMTSWGSGAKMSAWGPQGWQAGLPVRGVIGYHPLPKIRRCSLQGADLSLTWDGPQSDLANVINNTTNRVHGYLVEVSSSLTNPNFTPVSSVLVTNSFTITNCPDPAFVRVELVKP